MQARCERATPRLVVLTGPTAVGKSVLALALAERFGAEIISADSRQVYRGMEIGTAVPTPEDRARVPHHLVSYVEPDQPYDVATYQRDAEAALAGVAARGRPALLVGGSYHYIQAVVERLALPAVPPQPELRARLEAEEAALGTAALYARLAALDPAAAADILPGNLRRIVRALEVIEVTGRPFSAQSRRRGPPRPALRLALTCPRSELYRRIDERVDDMLAAGWLEEVRALLARGFDRRLPSMSASGYRELAAYLEGELTLEEAVRRTKFSTHAFARRQYAWFRRDPALVWIERGPGLERQAERLIHDYLTGGAEQE